MGKKTGAVKEKKSSKITKMNSEKGKAGEAAQDRGSQNEPDVIVSPPENRSKIKSLLRIAKTEKNKRKEAKQEKDSLGKTKAVSHKDGRGIRVKEGREKARRGIRLREIIRFFQSVWSEIKKVHWPSRSEIIVYTAVVLGSVGFVALLIWIADSILSYLLELIL